jgi:uncharacterized protein (TIGR00255 family)
VSVFATWNGGGEGPGVVVNAEAARQAAQTLRRLAEELGLPGPVTLDHVLAFPAVTAPGGATGDPEALWKAVAPVFETALRSLDALRQREGDDLALDMHTRFGRLRELGQSVEGRRPSVVDEYRARLTRRVEELTAGLPADVARERVAVEVAIFADRSDVEEELVRLRSHLDKAEDAVVAGGAVGRKLDFLLQELNREVNTIGSKASDAEVTRLVVEMKAELEKIREQVQNLE